MRRVFQKAESRRSFSLAFWLAIAFATASANGVGSAQTAPVFVFSHLGTYSVDELIALLSLRSSQANARENPKFQEAVARELAARGSLDRVFTAFTHAEDFVQRRWMARTLEAFPQESVDRRMRALLSHDVGEVNFLAASHFARRCDKAALRIMNDNANRYGISSLDMRDIAVWFGKCDYKPASTVLARWTNAMVLELSWAAQRSLAQMYPQASMAMKAPEKAHDAWERYLQSRGESKR